MKMVRVVVVLVLLVAAFDGVHAVAKCNACATAIRQFLRWRFEHHTARAIPSLEAMVTTNLNLGHNKHLADAEAEVLHAIVKVGATTPDFAPNAFLSEHAEVLLSNVKEDGAWCVGSSAAGSLCTPEQVCNILLPACFAKASWAPSPSARFDALLSRLREFKNGPDLSEDDQVVQATEATAPAWEHYKSQRIGGKTEKIEEICPLSFKPQPAYLAGSTVLKTATVAMEDTKDAFLADLSTIREGLKEEATALSAAKKQKAAIESAAAVAEDATNEWAVIFNELKKAEKDYEAKRAALHSVALFTRAHREAIPAAQEAEAAMAVSAEEEEELRVRRQAATEALEAAKESFSAQSQETIAKTSERVRKLQVQAHTRIAQKLHPVAKLLLRTNVLKRSIAKMAEHTKFTTAMKDFASLLRVSDAVVTSLQNFCKRLKKVNSGFPVVKTNDQKNVKAWNQFLYGAV